MFDQKANYNNVHGQPKYSIEFHEKEHIHIHQIASFNRDCYLECRRDRNATYMRYNIEKAIQVFNLKSENVLKSKKILTSQHCFYSILCEIF